MSTRVARIGKASAKVSSIRTPFRSKTVRPGCCRGGL
jgi:hypothetical protein